MKKIYIKHAYYFFLFLFLINFIKCSSVSKFYKKLLVANKVPNLGIYSPVPPINKKQCLFSQEKIYKKNIHLINELLLHDKYIKGVNLNPEDKKILHENLEKNKKRILLINYIVSGQDEKDNETFKNSFIGSCLLLYIIDKSLKKEKNPKSKNDGDDNDDE
jgi:hypothetical protein